MAPETYEISGVYDFFAFIPCFHLSKVGNIKVIERFFDLPLDYAEPSGKKIRVFARNLIPQDKAKTPEKEVKLPYCEFCSYSTMSLRLILFQ
jgi:hypothetical protein